MLTSILIALGIVVVLPLLFVALIAYSVINSMNVMAKAQVQQAGPEDAEMAAEIAKKYGNWAQKKKMRFLGYYFYDAVAPILIAAWQSQNPICYFCVYFVQNKYHLDIVSIIDENTGASLTTSTSKDTFMLPRPEGSYAQAFPKASPEQLLKYHVAAQQYLTSVKRIAFRHSALPFDQIIQRSIHQQMNFVREIPMYPFRAVWWYFVNRNTMADRTVEQQHRERAWT